MSQNPRIAHAVERTRRVSTLLEESHGGEARVTGIIQQSAIEEAVTLGLRDPVSVDRYVSFLESGGRLERDLHRRLGEILSDRLRVDRTTPGKHVERRLPLLRRLQRAFPDSRSVRGYLAWATYRMGKQNEASRIVAGMIHPLAASQKSPTTCRSAPSGSEKDEMTRPTLTNVPAPVMARRAPARRRPRALAYLATLLLALGLILGHRTWVSDSTELLQMFSSAAPVPVTAQVKTPAPTPTPTAETPAEEVATVDAEALEMKRVELAAAQVRYGNAREELAGFLATHGDVDHTAEISTEYQALAPLLARLLLVEGRITGLRAKLLAISDSSDGTVAMQVAERTVARNPIVIEEELALAKHLIERDHLASKHVPGSPYLQRIDDKIDALRHRLATRPAEHENVRVERRDVVAQRLEVDKAVARTALTGFEAESGEIRERIGNTRGRIAKLTRRRRELTRLERQLKDAEATLRDLSGPDALASVRQF